MYHTIKIFFESMGVLSVFTLMYLLSAGCYDYLKNAEQEILTINTADEE